MKTPTAYGGRLTWILPGGNLLKVHIKDGNKIRKRKRWSQVCVAARDVYVNIIYHVIYTEGLGTNLLAVYVYNRCDKLDVDVSDLEENGSCFVIYSVTCVM